MVATCTGVTIQPLVISMALVTLMAIVALVAIVTLMSLMTLMNLMALMASLPSCVFTDSRPVHFVAAAATRLVVLGAGEEGGPQQPVGREVGRAVPVAPWQDVVRLWGS